MTSSYLNRRTAGVITAALALGAAAPAGAQPMSSDAPVKFAPPAQAQHYSRANVLAPYTGIRATHYGKANVMPPYSGTPVSRPPAPAPAATPRAVASHPAPGDSSDLVYILVGGAVVALGGFGGTLAVVANRRRTAPARARIAG